MNWKRFKSLVRRVLAVLAEMRAETERTFGVRM